MKHLTIDEIIAFVTMDALTDENIQFAAKVNGHIIACEKCREKVTAFQAVGEKLIGIEGMDGLKMQALADLDR